MPFLDRLAGANAAPFVQNLGQPLTPVEAEEAASASRAFTSDPLTQGAYRGRRGLASGYRNWVGSGLEALGSPAAEDWYGAANREAHLGELESPDVPQYKDVRDLESAYRFAAGNTGAMATMLAPSLVTGGVAALARAAPATRVLAGMAPFHPVMAGGAAQELRADPVTAALPAGQRAGLANVSGALQAAAMTAPAAILQGRALGLAPVAKASLSPMRTLGGIAGDTAVATGAMGAGNVVGGEVARGLHRAYNPAYMTDPAALEEARKEELASAIGFAPVALPHAAMGRTFGASLDAGEAPATALAKALAAANNTLAAAAGTGAKAVKDKILASTPAQSAARSLRNSEMKVRNFFGLKDADKAATITGEELGRNDVSAIDEHVKNVEKHISENQHAQDINTDAFYDAAEAARQGADSGPLLEESAKIRRQFEEHGNLDTALPKKKAAPKEDEDAFSGQRTKDPVNFSVRNALGEAKIGKGTIDSVVKGIQLKNLVRDGATKTMQKIHDALVEAGVLKADDNWARRTPLYARIEDALKATLKEHSPDTHPEGTDYLAGPFSTAVHELTAQFLEKHPIENVPADTVAEKVVSFVDGLANAREDISADDAHSFARTIIGRYGEDGKQLLNDVVNHAEARWGEESEQFRRVAQLRESAGDVDTIIKKMQPLIHDSALRANLGERALIDMAHAWTEYEDKAAGQANKVRELEQKARDLPERSEARFFAMTKLIEARKNTAAPEEAFMDEFHRYFKDAASAKKAVAILQEYRKSTKRLTAPETAREADAGARAGGIPKTDEADVETDTSGGGALTKEQKEAAEKGYSDQEEGTPTYLGVESSFHGKGASERNVVEAPLSRYPSPDYPDPEKKGMAGAAIEQLAATVAEHRVADATWIGMQDWAKEAAADHGKGWKELLIEAMDASLAHDKARLKALANSGKSTVALERFLERRTKLAAELRADNRLDPKLVGSRFWSDRANVNYGYWKAKQASGKNLDVSAEQIHGLFGPHANEEKAEYAVRRAEKEGTAPVTKNGKVVLRPRQVVEQSMIPVETTTGRGKNKVVQKGELDVAFLTRTLMERHQPGDIIGTGSDETPSAAARASGKAETTERMHTKEEIASAVYNTLSTLADSKAITNAKEIFANLPDTLIAYRGPEGNFTLRALREMRSVNKAGDLVFRDKQIHKEVLDTVAPKPVRATDPVRAADAAAKQGILRGVLTDEKGNARDLDANKLLKHMLEINGMDPVEALDPANGISNKHAAQLLREGLQMLEDQHGLKLDRKTYGTVKDADREVRAAGDSAVVYKRFYGDAEDAKAAPITFKQLMDVDASGDKVPHNMVDSKLAEARDLVKSTTENVARILKLREEGKPGTWREENDLADALGRKKSAETAEGFATGQPEELNKPNRYAEEETLNTQIAQTVRDLARLSHDSAPLFDTATHNALNTFVKATQEQLARITKAQSYKMTEARGEDTVTDALSRRQVPRPGEDFAKRREIVKGRFEYETKRESVGMGMEESVVPVQERLLKELSALRALDRIVKNQGTNLTKRLDAAEAARHAREMSERKTLTAPEAAPPERTAFRAKDVEKAPEPQVGTLPEGEARGGTALTEYGEPVKAPTVSGTRTNAEPSTMEAAAAATTARAELNKKHRPYAEAAMERLLNRLGIRGPLNSARVERVLQDANYQATVREVARIEAQLKAKEITPEAALVELEKNEPAQAPAPVKPAKPVKPDEDAFSRQRVNEVARDLEQETHDLFHSQLPKEAGFSHRFAKEGLEGGQSGSFSKKTREAATSAFASDIHGTTDHEVWHGVESLLETMGKEGKHVLDTVYRHVDTKAMREALNAFYGDDPGVLAQLAEAKASERAAFAFQAFKNGAKFDLAPQTRSFFQKIVDWVKSTLRLSDDQTKSEAFFKYVAESGLLRDFDNPTAVLRGLAETRTDRFAAHVRDTVQPITDGLKVLAAHTSTRAKEMGFEPVTKMVEAFEGPTGKGGWQNAYLQKTNELSNEIARTLKDMNEVEQRAWMQDAARGKGGDFKLHLMDYAQKKLSTAGYSQHEADRIARRAFDNTFVVNAMKAHDNIGEFITDITNHGGLGGGSGFARDVANRIVEEGMHFDPALSKKLFAGREDLQEKWGDPSAVHEIAGAIKSVVRSATRAEFFGKNEHVISDAVAHVKEHGTAEQIKTLGNVIHAFEGTLGASDLSPGVKKLMNAVMVANNIRLLPMAVWTQMMDAGQLALRKNEPGRMFDTLGKAIFQLPRAFDKLNANYNPTTPQKLAEQFGMTADRHLGSVLSGVNTGYNMTGRVGRLNETFFKWTLQEQLNRSMYEIATGHAVEFLRDHHNLKDPQSVRWMKELGLEPGDVKFSSTKTFEGLNWESEKVRRAVNQYTREATALPDPGSNALWMNDQRFALLGQLKKFQFAHDRYILQRGIREFSHDNRMLPLAALAGSMGIQYATSQMRYMLTGGEPAVMKNWGFADYMTRAVEQSAAGRWNFFADAENAITHGSTPFETLAGPTVEGAGRITRALHKGSQNMLDTLFGQSGALVFPE